MAELVEDGYRNITVAKTWLGRLRFIAVRPGARREIVVNPATGEILRDYSRRSAEGRVDDDHHNDDDDDDDDRDNSGPGSANSGRDDDDDDKTDNSGSGSSGDDD